MSDALTALRALTFDAHPEPMWLVAREPGREADAGRILDANRAAVRRYGWSADEFRQLTLADLDSGTPAPAGTPGRSHRARQGLRFQVELRQVAIDHAAGAAWLVLARDVSARDGRFMQDWQQAGEIRLLLHDTLEQVYDGIVLFDAQRRYRYLNARLAHLLGVAHPAELVGQHIWERFPHRVGSAFHEAFERVMRTREACAVDDYFAPGDRWLDSRLYPTSDGGLAVTCTDVTEQRRAVRAVHDAREQWRRLAEQVPAIIYRADAGPGHAPRWISPRLADLGYDREAWLRDPGQFRQAIHPDDAASVQARVAADLAAHGEVDVEYRLRDANGRWHHIRDIARIVDGGAQGRYLQGVMFDVTAAHASAEALRQSRQALADLARRLMDQEKATGRRVAQALHDRLGQTLAVSRMHVDALAAALPADADPALRTAARQVSDLLVQAVAQVREVLVDLRPPLLDDHGLPAALDHEVRALPTTPGGAIVRLDLVTPSDVRWPTEIEHAAFMVAREALTNALRHAAAHEVRVVLAGDASGTWLALDVDDDGRGIAPALVEGRVGHLGIIGMRERATAAGATLALQQRPEGGTRVRFRWQATPANADAAPRSTSPTPPPPGA